MNDEIYSALDFIDPSKPLLRQDWIKVGMALKNSGYSVDVWEDWSRRDKDRFHEGECQKKWNGFGPSPDPVMASTIFYMAKERGWKPTYRQSRPLDWNDEIEYDGRETCVDIEATPVEEFKSYLKTLFKPEDYVSYVVDAIRDEDGKYKPSSKGVYNRTCKQLLDDLEKYPDDLSCTIGTWNGEAGAWIRFNAVDGKGIADKNVTSYRYALVESDTMSIFEQNQIYRALNLPIAVLVSSGNKSLHAIVKIDAESEEEYKKRVQYLYEYLEKNGLKIDKQNANPSRLSRLPGVTRGTERQRICDFNTGASSWNEWRNWIEGDSSDLPIIESLADIVSNPPALAPELISGILRCGHKMIVTGSSKAGKSFLLMELCVAFAEGVDWLGFKVKQGKVLYINLEIDRASCFNRILEIYKAYNLEPKNADNIRVWNLRGKALPLNELAPKIIQQIKDQGYQAVIIDPIYKIITGDENNATDMGKFCNQFDKICTETGCAAIYCHHHSKGAQGNKKSIDRGSGSGVFARDPDATLDMIELELTDDIKNNIRDDARFTAWRIETICREFASPDDVNVWFEYPIHRVDKANLTKLHADGESAPAKTKTQESEETMIAKTFDAFDLQFSEAENGEKFVWLKDMASYLNLSSDRAVRNRINKIAKMPPEVRNYRKLIIDNNKVFCKEDDYT